MQNECEWMRETCKDLEDEKEVERAWRQRRKTSTKKKEYESGALWVKVKNKYKMATIATILDQSASSNTTYLPHSHRLRLFSLQKYYHVLKDSGWQYKRCELLVV